LLPHVYLKHDEDRRRKGVHRFVVRNEIVDEWPVDNAIPEAVGGTMGITVEPTMCCLTPCVITVAIRSAKLRAAPSRRSGSHDGC
jgi:hypothetical protein